MCYVNSLRVNGKHFISATGEELYLEKEQGKIAKFVPCKVVIMPNYKQIIVKDERFGDKDVMHIRKETTEDAVHFLYQIEDQFGEDYVVYVKPEVTSVYKNWKIVVPLLVRIYGNKKVVRSDLFQVIE